MTTTHASYHSTVISSKYTNFKDSLSDRPVMRDDGRETETRRKTDECKNTNYDVPHDHFVDIPWWKGRKLLQREAPCATIVGGVEVFSRRETCRCPTWHVEQEPVKKCSLLLWVVLNNTICTMIMIVPGLRDQGGGSKIIPWAAPPLHLWDQRYL